MNSASDIQEKLDPGLFIGRYAPLPVYYWFLLSGLMAHLGLRYLCFLNVKKRLKTIDGVTSVRRKGGGVV